MTFPGDGGDIAYYVWTDIQLINAANTKKTLFPSRRATLYVLMLDRVSRPLVDAAERSGIFGRTVRVEPPEAYRDRPRLERRIRLIFSAGAYRRYFAAVVGDARYSTLIVSGYWSYAMFMLRAMYKREPGIRVLILEEGLGSYARTLKRMVQIWPRTSVEERLTRAVYFPFFAKKAAGLVDEALLYRPERAAIALDGIRTEGIPSLDRAPESVKALFSVWKDSPRIGSFASPQGIVFTMPPVNGAFKAADAAIIGRMREAWPELAVSSHPDEGGEAAPFEALCMRQDISGKTLIGCYSSCMLMPKYAFSQEPRVIFTYATGAYDGVGASFEVTEKLAAALRELYEDKTRVMIPRSEEELLRLLKRFSPGPEAAE